MTQLNALIPNAANVRFFSNALDFALYLLGLGGHPIMTQHAAYDLDKKDKMLVNKRGTRGNNAIKNPYRGVGLVKYAVSQMTVSFDCQKKVESREGLPAESQGNWIQAVIVKNQITPLATHKGDIETRLKDGIDANSDDAKLIANQVAVLSDDGSVIFKTDEPRLYLRYEVIRTGDALDRNEKKMRSRSCYRKADGTFVDKKDLADYLPDRQPRLDQTDYQLTALDNIVELRFNGERWRKRTTDVQVADIIEAAKATADVEDDAVAV